MIFESINTFLENGRKFGIISTFFTKHFFEKHLELFEIPSINIEQYIVSNNITALIIDNDLYEEDHVWYSKDLTGLLSLLKFHNLEIIVIKNSDIELSNIYREYSVINMVESKSSANINFKKNTVDLPILVDEYKFNPINHTKKIDILFLNKGKLSRGKDIQLLQDRMKPIRKEIVFDNLSRKLIFEIIEFIKQSKIIYIYHPERIDKKFLKYIEIISILQHTVVTYDSENISSEYALNNPDILNINYMATIKEDNLYTDKLLLPKQRSVLLKHTFVRYLTLKDIFYNQLYKPNITVITPTNRKYYLERYINQLNNQNEVTLEVILLVHGLDLTDDEKDVLFSKSKFDLKIMDMDQSQSLGFCLNIGILKAKNKYIAKIDDDDFYYENYLLDSWLAKMYSNADLVGKHSTFTYLNSIKVTLKNNLNSIRRYQKFVMGATFFCERKFMTKYMFSNLPTGEDSDFLKRINDDNAIIYTDHPYNFCIFRSDNLDVHTWRRADIEFFKNAIIAHHGDPEDYVSL